MNNATRQNNIPTISKFIFDSIVRGNCDRRQHGEEGGVLQRTIGQIRRSLFNRKVVAEKIDRAIEIGIEPI